MNPDVNPQNHFNLPSPLAEAQLGASESGLPAPEQSQAARPETGLNAGASMPPVMAQNHAQQLVAAQAQSIVQSAVPVTSQPLIDDSDDAALDKAWVFKAKQIVLQTANDPYAQNRQLAQMKSEYLQRRYGKVVKLAD